jgi:hypothetical protein
MESAKWKGGTAVGARYLYHGGVVLQGGGRSDPADASQDAAVKDIDVIPYFTTEAALCLTIHFRFVCLLSILLLCLTISQPAKGSPVGSAAADPSASGLPLGHAFTCANESTNSCDHRCTDLLSMFKKQYSHGYVHIAYMHEW